MQTHYTAANFALFMLAITILSLFFGMLCRFVWLSARASELVAEMEVNRDE